MASETSFDTEQFSAEMNRIGRVSGVCLGGSGVGRIPSFTADVRTPLPSINSAMLRVRRLSAAATLLVAALSGRSASIAEIEHTYDLPDFSYAGYHRSEQAIPTMDGPVFNIVAFGAKPNDGRSDPAALQAGIRAAAERGGGVVWVPRGRFDLGEPGDAGSIFIRSSHIVLRGEGAGRSELHMSEALAPPPPMRLWGSPYVIQVLAPLNARVVGEVARDVARGDFEVWLTSADGLKPGDWITLTLQDGSPALRESELAGFQVIDSRWQSLVEEGVQVAERHEIEAVSGQRVRLCTPVIKSIDARYAWRVEQFEPLREIGFEGLRF